MDSHLQSEQCTVNDVSGQSPCSKLLFAGTAAAVLVSSCLLLFNDISIDSASVVTDRVLLIIING